MADIFKNFSLKEYNTFHIEAYADFFAKPKSVETLVDILKKKKYANLQRLVIGGGSNILFTGEVSALLIQPDIKGIKLIEESQGTVLIKVAAGEVWDDFVVWAVENNYYGIENLSLIPGRVGAAPVQNIGAYGVEVKDVIEKVRVVDLKTGTPGVFINSECDFAYRDSIFKNKQKGKYIITHVYFRLKKQGNFNLDYGNLKTEVQKFDTINLQTVRQAVINIRRFKLPDPDELPNAGSFFKNPTVSINQFNELKQKFPDIVNYPIDDHHIKLAAGWMIDFCGLKGHRQGDAGVHKNQALVLVNYGNAKGADILNLAEYVRSEVFNTFGIKLDFEVNVF